MLAWAVMATAVCGALAIGAGSLAFAAPKRSAPYLVSFAAGVLLAAAFLHLLPEAARTLPLRPLREILAVTLAAVLAAFVLEAALELRVPNASSQSGTLILAASALHNVTDGVLVGAAFAVDPSLGVATTAAILAHEIPREIANFAVLRSRGFSRRCTVVLSAACRVPGVVGAIAAFTVFSVAVFALPFVVAFAAGAFIYIAAAELMPSLTSDSGSKEIAARSACMALGAACIAAVGYWPTR